ncbi:MAG: membrane protein [Melioribacteraceae bacterium]|nr:MAG: membrane protein [Melioribacteraceae bacterium]
MKKIILKIHGYLGLFTGFVVFIVSVTGCLWVFEKEIKSIVETEYIISKGSGEVINPVAAKELAQKVFPERNVHGTLYHREISPIEVIFYEPEPEFYQSVMLHPYSGEVLEVINHENGFFAFILDGHMNLWLPEKVGSNIVAFSVLTFLIILISGFFLWMPKRRNLKQRFYFQWKDSTRWKRKNFDLHSIIGFYVLLFAFVLAFTGSVMAYDWFYYLTYKAAGGEKAPQFSIPENTSEPDSLKKRNNLADVINIARMEFPDAVSYEIHYPHDDSASIYVEVTSAEGVYYSSDYIFYDSNTLDHIETPGIYGRYEDANFADMVIRTNYDIHVGAIGGLPGKIIAFMASLVTATLPVTGFLLWYGRNKKKN